MNKQQNIIFFDGVCVLCNGIVDHIIKYDKQKRLKFASLQGETAKIKLNNSYIRDLDSIVYLREGRFHTKSDAILYILRDIANFYALLFVFIIIPKFIRDFFYDLIARSRYKLFGRNEFCRMPDESLKDRILP